MKSQHFPPIEVELYVVNNTPTEKEMKELNAFIEKIQNKQMHAKKIKPASTTRKAIKYEIIEATMAAASEPEPNQYVEHRPLTEKDKKKRKLTAKGKAAGKKTRD
jgi:hypothetical protein